MPSDDQDADPRRFLIAAAVADSPVAGPGWARPGLHRARDELVSLFTSQFQYTLVDTVGMNPTGVELLDALNNFSRDPDRRPDDILAVYFTGHGERLDELDRHVLLTADSDPDQLHRAVRASDIAEAVLYRTSIRRLLLMLDTCYSGKGGAEFAVAVLNSFASRWTQRSGNGVVVLSSAQPRQQAQAGLFPDLLAKATESMAAAGERPPTIAVQALTTEIAKHATELGGQDVSFHEIALTDAEPPFLPNPRHRVCTTEVDLALQQALDWQEHAERREVEFRTRLLVRAMGDHNRDSWWFCGRHTVLRDINEWLTCSDTTRSLLAVTGDPGSGKTAVLGLIAALSHPEYYRTVPVHTLAIPSEAVPVPGTVGVAIYAQGLTTHQILHAIAAAAHLTSDTVGELIEALGERNTSMIVLIDGLDEAEDPLHLIRTLLRPLLDYPSTRIRLLVGTRSYLLHEFGLDRESALDLDAPRYADMEALTTYAARVLVETTPDGVYSQQEPSAIWAVAAAVSERVAPSFLVARIVATTLAAAPNVTDPTDPAWRADLPTHAGDAMRRDLQSRLGKDAEKAEALLRPLAFAQGQGLPWEDLWAPIATAIAGVHYSDDDLLWLRRTAGSYVVEALENGRSSYRLYHQALAEHLTANLDPVPIHAAFVKVLCERVLITADGRRDWERANPYAIDYLATHAAAAGAFDILAADTDYLIHAQPATLLAAMNTINSEQGRRLRAIYRASVGVHREATPEHRRQILAVDAARFQDNEYLARFDIMSTWRLRWCTNERIDYALRDTLTGHMSMVHAIACTEIANTPVAVTAGYDHTVRIWDLTASRLRVTMKGHSDPVRAVCCTHLRDCPIAVTGDASGKLLVWDLDAETLRVELEGHETAVNAVCCTEFDGKPALVSCGDDGVRIWDLSTGKQKGTIPSGGRRFAFEAMECTTIGDKPVLLTGGIGEFAAWDLTTLNPLQLIHSAGSSAQAIAVTAIAGTPVVVTGSYDCRVRVWDLTTGELRGELIGHSGQVTDIACTLLGANPVALTSSFDDTIRIWDLTSLTLRTVLNGHTSAVDGISCTYIGDTQVAVSASGDRTVRVWELDTEETGAADTHENRATGQAFRTVSTIIGDQSIVIAANADSTIRQWDLATGTLHRIMRGHTESAVDVSCIRIVGSLAIVSIGFDRVIRVWDPVSGALQASLSESGDSARTVDCVTIDEVPVAVCGGRDATISIWDLLSETVVAVLTGHTGAIRAIACCEIDETPLAVTAGSDGTARIWDLRTHTLRATLSEHANEVNSVVFANIGGTSVVLTGDREGVLRAWDLHSGVLRAKIEAHSGAIFDVAYVPANGRSLAITGGSDKFVRLWDLDLGIEVDRLHFPTEVDDLDIGPGGEIVVAFRGEICVLDLLLDFTRTASRL
ncbi:caspase family protein [Nocardia rhamnosiphila]